MNGWSMKSARGAIIAMSDHIDIGVKLHPRQTGVDNPTHDSSQKRACPLPVPQNGYPKTTPKNL
jgi:hypothetical protein